jgi:beta-glucosidase
MIDNLSLPELVAQMFVVRASGYLFDHQIRYRSWEPTASKLRYYLEELGVGGVILVGGKCCGVGGLIVPIAVLGQVSAAAGG